MAERYATGLSSSTPSNSDSPTASANGNSAQTTKGSNVKSKKKLLIIAVIVLALAGVGVWKFALPHKAAPATGGDVVALDPQTLNLVGGHYLKVGVSVQLVKGKASATAWPVAEADQLTIAEFANRTEQSMDTNAARDRLDKDLLAKIKKAYPGEVFNVFITQFVMQ